MARMYEGGGYGVGQLQLAGNCKKCKVMTMVDIDSTKSNMVEQLNGSLCKICHEEEFGLQAQRDKKLELLFASKKKWWEFWKD
jgi:hypothetical protein